MTNEAIIIKTLTPYLAAFPQSKLDAGGLAVYARALSSIPPEQIDAAMIKLLRTSRFFPTVAEIIDTVGTLKAYMTGTHELTAAEAWEMVMREAKAKMLYKKWTLPKTVETAVKCFGRAEICNLQEREVNTARAQFTRFYEALLKKDRDKQEYKAALQTLPSGRLDKIIGQITGGNGNGKTLLDMRG